MATVQYQMEKKTKKKKTMKKNNLVAQMHKLPSLLVWRGTFYFFLANSLSTSTPSLSRSSEGKSRFVTLLANQALSLSITIHGPLFQNQFMPRLTIIAFRKREKKKEKIIIILLHACLQSRRAKRCEYLEVELG